MNQLPNLIQNGMFGQTQPMSGPYNPYNNFSNYMNPPIQSNMIPVGSYNYNQSAFQQQTSSNGYVFQPAGGGYNPNPPVQNYYNPYPQYQQQPIYSYNNYMNYSPFLSMQKQQDMMNAEIEKNKLRVRIMAKMQAVDIEEDKLDEMYNPNNPKNIKSQEQIDQDTIWNRIITYHSYSLNPNKISTPESRLADFMNRCVKNYHEAFDNHHLSEFFNEDYPRLSREFWIAENIKRNAQQDMSTTYNSAAYNELLNWHRSSNPYINELMDQSRYDNNIDDTEVGLAEMFDRERRRRNVLEGKLPTYISSPEVQQKRAEYTRELMDMIYRKEAKKQNV